MSIDHVSFQIGHDKFEEEVKFMTAAFGHVGFKEIMRPCEYVVGMGVAVPNYWLSGRNADGTPYEDKEKGIYTKHIGIGVESRELVDKFYDAAIAAGGKDNGKPGIRADYHPNYYGAFVISPAGINLEAVYHGLSPAS